MGDLEDSYYDIVPIRHKYEWQDESKFYTLNFPITVIKNLRPAAEDIEVPIMASESSHTV